MPGISANVSDDYINVIVDANDKVSVGVSNGIGPQGPPGSSGVVNVSAPITNTGTSSAAVIGLSAGSGLAVSSGSLVVSYGSQAGTVCQGNDARLSDAREWSAATVSQTDAEAGSSTSRFAYTPLRVFQAIAAWWAGSAAKTKLDGIASGATANATDAQLRDRATHTGTQPASTISDFTTAVIAAAPPTTDASLLVQGILPDARLSANIARASDVSAAQSAAASDATTKASAAQAYAIQRANHTGSQAIGTVAGLQAALDGKAASSHSHDASAIVTGTLDAARLPPISGETVLLSDGSTLVGGGNAGDFLRELNSSSLAYAIELIGGDVPVDFVTGLAPIATSGSASDLSAGTVPVARLPVGQTATSVAAGNDARFTDARTPTGAAGGDLTGNYPNPQIAPGAVVTADIADGAVTDAKIAAVSAAKLTGTIADARLSANVVLTGDARLSDARTPLAHTHDAAAITTGTVAAARLPLATRAQAIDGSASSAVVSPSAALDQLMASGHLDLSAANVSTAGQNLWQTAFSGAVSISVGSASGGGSVYVAHYLSGSPYMAKWNGLSGGSSTGNFSGRYIDWTKRQLFVLRMSATSAVSANAVLRVNVGKGQLGTANIGALDRRGVGFEIRSGGALWLVSHNGTTRTDTNTGFTFPSANNIYEIAIESTGTGTANLYLDSVVRATNSGAPTTQSTTEQSVMLTVEATTTDLSSSGFGFDRYFRYLRP